MDYQESYNQFFIELGEHKKFVLATSANNRTTARMMSCLIIQKKIYFQTDKQFLKFQQILSNPLVALCIDNISIEGTAKIMDHPISIKNKDFTQLYEKYYKPSFDKYSHLKDEIVVEIEPTLITQWCYDNGKPYRYLLTVSKKKLSKNITRQNNSFKIGRIYFVKFKAIFIDFYGTLVEEDDRLIGQICRRIASSSHMGASPGIFN